MATTAKKAQRPADKDVTSPANDLVHQIKVNDVIVSVFADERATVQRRYRTPEGKVGYAHSLRPNDFEDARLALRQLISWYADYVDACNGSDAE